MAHASNTRHHTTTAIGPDRTAEPVSATSPVEPVSTTRTTKPIDTKPTNTKPTCTDANTGANKEPPHATDHTNPQNPEQPTPSRTHSNTGNLTHGPLIPAMLRFSIPYLITCFLQSCYELVDLLIVGRFNGADSVSAVSTGSQMTHLVTVTIVGLATGVTVTISHAIGAKRMDKVQRQIGQSIRLFTLVAIIATIILATCADPLLRLLATPPEAFSQAHDYVTICFLGTPFIVAYNVISAIFRGFGDSRHPMYFVALAGLLNVGLDLAFIGGAHMQAAGAALATVISQAFSVAAALVYLNIANSGIWLRTTDLAYDWAGTRQILTIGTPIALQELCIQVSFIVITAIANGRGLEISASVGIVEKIISFLFLVPSAMLSTVSVVAGQNAGARQHHHVCDIWCGHVYRLPNLGCRHRANLLPRRRNGSQVRGAILEQLLLRLHFGGRALLLQRILQRVRQIHVHIRAQYHFGAGGAHSRRVRRLPLVAGQPVPDGMRGTARFASVDPDLRRTVLLAIQQAASGSVRGMTARSWLIGGCADGMAAVDSTRDGAD